MDTRESSNRVSREGFSLGEPLSLMTVCLDTESLGQVRRFAESTPLVRLRATAPNYLTEDQESLHEWIRGVEVDVCLIDFDVNRKSATYTAERIHEKLSGTSIFAISSNSQPGAIIESMRCGCSEYLVKPVNHDQLLDAIARVDGRKREKKETTTGEVLAFLGAKGGCGVTTLATHLGALLSKSFSRRAVLADLHPAFGDAALYLGMTKYRYSFFELAESKDRLDANLLQGFLLRHPSGLDLLPAPELFDPSRRVAPDDIGQTIDFLRAKYEFVLIDCPPGLNKLNLEAVARADQLYVVTVPEVSALANAVRYVDYFARAEYSLDRVRIVLNRSLKRGVISDEEIEKALRKSIFWKVPNQYNQVIRTIHDGDPSSRLADSEVARTVQAWAESVGKRPDPREESKAGGKGPFSLFGR